MKKSVLFLVVFVLFAVGIYADDNSERGALSLSAGYTYTGNPELHGGHINLGIDFLQRDRFYLQNNFLFRAGGFSYAGVENTVLTLSEKIIFGRFEDELAIYIYIEGGAGFYTNSQNGFSSDTFVYTFGYGGGFEFGSGDFGGIYVEAGYIGQKMITDFPLSGVVVQTGWKIYF
ncbi:MAG: hypothetical protein LBI28_00730 [Treponema sp.]|jgi:hypothetical protein|nr:hypothetical protein [Treponema sp.]